MQAFEESLLLFAGQEFVAAGDGAKQNFRVTVIQVRSRQEVGADHFQTVPARFIRAEHQSCSIHRLLDHRNLALINF